MAVDVAGGIAALAGWLGCDVAYFAAAAQRSGDAIARHCAGVVGGQERTDGGATWRPTTHLWGTY